MRYTTRGFAFPNETHDFLNFMGANNNQSFLTFGTQFSFSALGASNNVSITKIEITGKTNAAFIPVIQCINSQNQLYNVTINVEDETNIAHVFTHPSAIQGAYKIGLTSQVNKSFKFTITDIPTQTAQAVNLFVGWGYHTAETLQRGGWTDDTIMTVYLSNNTTKQINLKNQVLHLRDFYLSCLIESSTKMILSNIGKTNKQIADISIYNSQYPFYTGEVYLMKTFSMSATANVWVYTKATYNKFNWIFSRNSQGTQTLVIYNNFVIECNEGKTTENRFFYQGREETFIGFRLYNTIKSLTGSGSNNTFFNVPEEYPLDGSTGYLDDKGSVIYFENSNQRLYHSPNLEYLVFGEYKTKGSYLKIFAGDLYAPFLIRIDN